MASLALSPWDEVRSASFIQGLQSAGLPAEQVAALAAKVRDRSYLFLSPYPGLDVPVSVQAWGYQLKVSSAADPRIDGFIQSYRMTATLEPNAPCSGGTTATS